jgi:hypothetical protein
MSRQRRGKYRMENEEIVMKTSSLESAITSLERGLVDKVSWNERDGVIVLTNYGWRYDHAGTIHSTNA